MKEKIINFYKKRFLLIACFLCSLIFLFVLGSFYSDNFLTKTYYDKDFKSIYTKDDQKTIDKDGESVDFTYGPYINLKKGDYNVKINYQSEEDNYFDITADYGVFYLAKGKLPKESESVDAKIEVKEDKHCSGIEIRTFYKGTGRFTFESAEITKIGVFPEDVANLAGAAIFLALILFLIKSKMLNKISFFILTAFYILFFLFMWQSVMGFIAGYVTLLIFTVMFLLLDKNIDNIIKYVKGEEIISYILTSYIVSSIMFLFMSDESAGAIDFIKTVGFSNLLFLVSLFFGVLFILRLFHKRPYINYRIMFIFVLWYSIDVIFELENNIYLEIGVILILLYFMYFLFKDDKMRIMDIKMRDRTAFIILCVLFLCAFYFVAINTIYQYKVYRVVTYDFGIFAQMFENMAKTGLPVTTCERGELLSHFMIHFSPIYYLVLPFYMLFRNPEGLLWIQAFAVTSVIFPVYLVSRKFKNSPFLSLILSTAVMMLPAFISPAYIDFHENKFLAVMIFWFIYFMEKYIDTRNKKTLILIFIFEALTLMIKEDAALYMITLSLYYIIARKEYKIGLIVFLSSIIYFTAVMAFIQSGGKGLMEGHYELYYLPGQDGVVNMFVNIIQNPTFFIKNMFTERTFIFTLYMAVPLMFIPFMCKDYKNLILFIPFVFINLMTDYIYQSDIGYQYNYGTGALLVFLFILNLKDKKLNFKYTICVTAVFASVFMLYANRGGDLTRYKQYYKIQAEVYEARNDVLRKYIPEDASVAANKFIVPHLYKNYYLYTFDKDFDLSKKVDYIVIYQSDTEYINLINKDEYEPIYSDDLLIYERRKG